MALFVTRHQHSAEGCPAGDPGMGPMLLQHVSPDNASKVGIDIRGEAVVQDHTFYMVLEAQDILKVQEFMAPFAQVGRVEIWEGSSCRAVVDRRGCGPGGKAI